MARAGIIFAVLFVNPELVVCLSLWDVGLSIFNVISENLYDRPVYRIDPEVFMNVVSVLAARSEVSSRFTQLTSFKSSCLDVLVWVL